MKIFATIDYLHSPLFPITSGNNSRNKFVYGAWVGAENFYYALLKYGTFDEYYFFVDSKLSANLLKKNISLFNFNLEKIKIINIRDSVSCLEKIKYTVFFYYRN